MLQRKEGTPLSLERAHEIFNGLIKGRDFSYEAEKPLLERDVKYIAMRLHDKLAALFGKTSKPVLQFRESDNPEQISRLCNEAFDTVDATVEQLEAWALNASIRHEIKFRFQKICEVLGLPSEIFLESAQRFNLRQTGF